MLLGFPLLFMAGFCVWLSGLTFSGNDERRKNDHERRKKKDGGAAELGMSPGDGPSHREASDPPDCGGSSDSGGGDGGGGGGGGEIDLAGATYFLNPA